MFKKQRLNFILLNTSIFFILFILFNLEIFLYIKSNLYKGVDRTLLISKKLIETKLVQNSTILSPTNSLLMPLVDPRIIPIFRDAKGNLLIDAQLTMFYKVNINNIKPIKIDELYNIKFNKFYFRTIAFSAYLRNKTIMVQLLRNTNSENEFLDNILKIIIFGGFILLIISVGAGIFLAQKTMIPIVNAWKKQRQFVEDASHELRTPLTIVQSQIEIILKNPDSTVLSNANHIGTVLSETRRLAKLISDLLTLARSDSNILEIKKKPIDISHLIRKICDPYIEIGAIDGKNIQLNIIEHLIINCDMERISQLIVILLDNALKYTNEGSDIEVNLCQENNKCIIYVKDTGIGIREEELELIFERFYRGDKSRTRVTGGTGLGLSIAKWIVAIHGGSIKAIQNKPKGTIIKTILPIN
jgi:two-component system, OmpR family, sensor histidine kinase CiaH